jgi:hypothetical protein
VRSNPVQVYVGWLIPRKIFPQKMLGKFRIFRGKSFEKSLFQQIPRNFPRKVIFRGKKCTKNRPLGWVTVALHGSCTVSPGLTVRVIGSVSSSGTKSNSDSAVSASVSLSKSWGQCYETGTAVMIFLIFSPKHWRFSASFCKHFIITLIFEKNADFFAENWQKSQEIVIITSTPGSADILWKNPNLVCNIYVCYYDLSIWL